MDTYIDKNIKSYQWDHCHSLHTNTTGAIFVIGKPAIRRPLLDITCKGGIYLQAKVESYDNAVWDYPESALILRRITWPLTQYPKRVEQI
jgi:hypothetical protein